MRKTISDKLIQHLETHPSRLFQRLVLAVLMKETAAALGLKPAQVLAAGDPLSVYAQFTKQAGSSPKTDPEKLYERMHRLGIRLRKMTGFTEKEDLYRLLFLLYRTIHISMSGNTEEGFRFTECYFSRYYSPQECAVISALDSGIVSGLIGKGRLEFTQRITAGCSICKASFKRGDDYDK